MWPTATPSRVGVTIGTGIGGLGDHRSQRPGHAREGPPPGLAVPGPDDDAQRRRRRRLDAVRLPGSVRDHGHGLCRRTHTRSAAPLRFIRSGICDAVIAGGTESALTVTAIQGLHQHDGAVVERTVRVPFSADRDGFVIAEGAAVLVLEEMDRARGPWCDHPGRGVRIGQHRRRAPHHRARTRVDRAPSAASGPRSPTHGSTRPTSPRSTLTAPRRR